MFDNKFLREIIINELREDNDKFVIYPFGENGVAFKRCLEDCFDISPLYIVDNILANYNPDIINLWQLKDAYKENMSVVLTMENKEDNLLMESRLKTLLPACKIINLLNLQNKSLNCESCDINKFRAHSFLVGKIGEEPGTTNGKIKIRILYSSLVAWNAIETICEAFDKDEMFDLRIIIGALYEEEKILNVNNYEYVIWTEYDSEVDKPDVLILTHPYDRETILQGIRKNTKLIVVASNQLLCDANTYDDFWKLQEQGYKRFEPDYYLYDSLLFYYIKNSSYYSEKIVEMGNAKFDGIYYAGKKKKYLGGWDKLKDKRKIILWTIDHGVYPPIVSTDVTFDIYAKVIIGYAVEHSDIGLLFRPHPIFVKEMLKNNIWTDHDFEHIKNYFEQSPNLVWDDSSNYNAAYSVADGIIADAHCGIICSALPTKKPICAMFRNVDTTVYHPELIKVLYTAHADSEVIEYMEMVREGNDSMYEKRNQAMEKIIKHYDGKNGWRIKEFVKSKILGR